MAHSASNSPSHSAAPPWRTSRSPITRLLPRPTVLALFRHSWPHSTLEADDAGMPSSRPARCCTRTRRRRVRCWTCCAPTGGGPSRSSFCRLGGYQHDARDRREGDRADNALGGVFAGAALGEVRDAQYRRSKPLPGRLAAAGRGAPRCSCGCRRPRQSHRVDHHEPDVADLSGGAVSWPESRAGSNGTTSPPSLAPLTKYTRRMSAPMAMPRHQRVGRDRPRPTKSSALPGSQRDPSGQRPPEVSVAHCERRASSYRPGATARMWSLPSASQYCHSQRIASGLMSAPFWRMTSPKVLKLPRSAHHLKRRLRRRSRRLRRCSRHLEGEHLQADRMHCRTASSPSARWRSLKSVAFSGRLSPKVASGNSAPDSQRGLACLRQPGIAFCAVVVVGADDQLEARVLGAHCLRDGQQVARIERDRHRVSGCLMNAGGGGKALGDANHVGNLPDDVMASTLAPIWKESLASIGADSLDAAQRAVRVPHRDY